MPVKKSKIKKNNPSYGGQKAKTVSTSLRAKAKQSKDSRKIATSSKAPRNDIKTISKKPGLSVPVYSLASARESGTLSLPKEYFGAKINKALLAQALRVYLTNQKSHWASTKTRGEVEGSTRKVWKQKGTGRARHGGVRAPIFIGGGIALGPKPRKVILDLPKKMKKASLISALSQKALAGDVVGLSGTDKATGKTKEIANLLKKINSKSALIVLDKKSENLERAAKNIKNIDVRLVKNINTYEVIRYKKLILTKEAVALLGASKEVTSNKI